VVAALGNLVQAYAIYADRGREAELAALFTADATWDGTQRGYGAAEGPESIAATVLVHFDPGTPMMHVPGPPLLVAVATTMCAAPLGASPPGSRAMAPAR
jgi:hypothetical protein